jgi:transcriptional regulator with XRE-family HTH domain
MAKRKSQAGKGPQAGRPIAGSIGKRLRELRTHRNMSQGDIEEKTGLLRCYVSRVEGGYTIPSVETLEKFAAALAVPLHALFQVGDAVPPPAPIRARATKPSTVSPFTEKIRRLTRRMDGRGREVFLSLLRKMVVLGAGAR